MAEGTHEDTQPGSVSVDPGDPAVEGDLELLRRVRHSTDPSARSELRRRHGHGLLTVAAAYTRGSDAAGPVRSRDLDRIVDDAFTALESAPLPDTDGSVLLVLCVLVRRAATGDAVPSLTDVMTKVDRLRRPDRIVLDAYASLDERDRVLLWFVATEGALPARLTRQLSIGGSDVAATLSHRARTNLRRAFAARWVTGGDHTRDCAMVAPELVRLADGSTSRIHDPDRRVHVAGCDRCSALIGELAELPTQLTVAIASIERALRGDDATTGLAAPAPPASLDDASEPTTLVDEAGPILISTTPQIEPTITVTSADSATRAIDPTRWAMDDAEDAEVHPRRRGRTAAITVSVVVVALAIGLWMLTQRSDTDPVDGAPSTALSTSTTVGTGGSTTSPSTSMPTSTVPPSTSTPTTIAQSTSIAPATTRRVTPAPVPVPPPATRPTPAPTPSPTTPASTAAPTTVPATSAPPTAPPPTTDPPVDP